MQKCVVYDMMIETPAGGRGPPRRADGKGGEAAMPNRVNYQLAMEKVLDGLAAEGSRPRLLLHACCAPCSSATLERLAGHF